MRVALLVAATALALFASCWRRSDWQAQGVDGKPSVTVGAPRPLLPRYQGPSGLVLVFFDDCHCELAGEDSVHFSWRYNFDETHGALWIEGMPRMEVRPDGTFVEDGKRDAGLWARLADDGHWLPIDGKGSARRSAPPRFPDACHTIRSSP